MLSVSSGRNDATVTFSGSPSGAPQRHFAVQTRCPAGATAKRSDSKGSILTARSIIEIQSRRALRPTRRQPQFGDGVGEVGGHEFQV